MSDLRFVTNHLSIQFEATFDMLKAAVEKCPDAMWDDLDAKPAYWHEAYHALFWLDNFVGDRNKTFDPKPFGVNIDPRLFRDPGTTRGRDELLLLLEIARGHVAQRLADMTDADLEQEDGFGEESSEFDRVLRRILYGLRHGQHHVGKLAGRLAASGVSVDVWRGNEKPVGASECESCAQDAQEKVEALVAPAPKPSRLPEIAESGRKPSVTSPPGDITVDAFNPDPFVIQRAVDALLDGHVIVIPTDTVYGVAADATNPAAVAKLYEIKRRSPDMAIPLLISERRMLNHISPMRGGPLGLLCDECWPGPLTIVLPRYSGALNAVSQTDTIGVRMPNHTVALAIISMLQRPLAVTSANVSGEEPATSAEAARAALGPSLSIVVDAGPTPGPVASTVLDLTTSPARILREGVLSSNQLEEILGEKPDLPNP